MTDLVKSCFLNEEQIVNHNKFLGPRIPFLPLEKNVHVLVVPHIGENIFPGGK